MNVSVYNEEKIRLKEEIKRIKEEMEIVNRKIDDLLSFDLWTPEAQQTLDLRYKKLQSRLEEKYNALFHIYNIERA